MLILKMDILPFLNVISIRYRCEPNELVVSKFNQTVWKVESSQPFIFPPCTRHHDKGPRRARLLMIIRATVAAAHLCQPRRSIETGLRRPGRTLENLPARFFVSYLPFSPFELSLPLFFSYVYTSYIRI